jgi:hypothetical protein
MVSYGCAQISSIFAAKFIFTVAKTSSIHWNQTKLFHKRGIIFYQYFFEDLFVEIIVKVQLESDRNNLIKLLTDLLPVNEDTITRIVVMYYYKLPLTVPETLDILEILLKRAASLSSLPNYAKVSCRYSNGNIMYS